MGARSKKRTGPRKGGVKKLKAKSTNGEFEVMDVDQPIDQVAEEKKEKDKLHQVIKKNDKKKRKNRKNKRSEKGMKLKVTKILNAQGGADIEMKEGDTPEDDKKKSLGLKELVATYQWAITLAGIPKTWKGDIKELADNYEQYGMKAYALGRQSSENGISQALYIFFESRDEMTKAVLAGAPEFEGSALTLRTNPPWTVFVSGVPFSVDEDAACKELKEALGKTVYSVILPKSDKGKKLGYAVAHTIDEEGQTALLTDCSLNLWNNEQHCYTKKDFTSKFVLHVLSGWQDRSQSVLSKLVEFTKKLHIEAAIDPLKRKMYFLDENSCQTVLKKSGVTLGDRKMIFSPSPATRFIVKNIKMGVEEAELLELFKGVEVFNVSYTERRCKATFDVAAEDVEKCKALHQQELAGRNIVVLQVGSEELKVDKEETKKKFQKLVEKKIFKSDPADRVHSLQTAFNSLKYSKPGDAKKERASGVSLTKTKVGKLAAGKSGGKFVKMGRISKKKTEIGKVKKIRGGKAHKRHSM